VRNVANVIRVFHPPTKPQTEFDLLTCLEKLIDKVARDTNNESIMQLDLTKNHHKENNDTTNKQVQ
jgi:hypothetical protein